MYRIVHNFVKSHWLRSNMLDMYNHSYSLVCAAYHVRAFLHAYFKRVICEINQSFIRRKPIYEARFQRPFTIFFRHDCLHICLKYYCFFIDFRPSGHQIFRYFSSRFYNNPNYMRVRKMCKFCAEGAQRPTHGGLGVTWAPSRTRVNNWIFFEFSV